MCVCVWCVCVCVCVCVFLYYPRTAKPVDTTYNFSYRPVKYLIDALFPCFEYFLMFSLI